MSSLTALLGRRLSARLVLALSLTLAGGLAPAHGESSEELPPFILTQAVGVSFQKNDAPFTGVLSSLGSNADSAAAVTSGLTVSGISGGTLVVSGGTLNLGSSSSMLTGTNSVTISSAVIRFSDSNPISDSTSTVNFNLRSFVADGFGSATFQITPTPISLIQPSGVPLDIAHLYNVQPEETGAGLVKTGAGTLQLSGATGTVNTITGTVTALERPAIYPLDPSVAPTGFLTGGVIRLFDPANGVIGGGTLSLAGGSVNQSTSILSGAPFDLATGTIIVPTYGAILTVNGTGNQIVTGSNTRTINANTFTGSTLSVTGGTLSAGTLLLRANSDPALTLNGQTVLDGTNIVSGGQTLSLSTAVPEPGSAALLLCGALGLATVRRRRGA